MINSRFVSNRPLTHRVVRAASAVRTGGRRAASTPRADSVGAHRRWGAVAVVIRPGAEASDASDPVVDDNYDVDFIVSAGGRLDAVETITAQFPADATASSSTGRSTTRTTPACARRPRSPRSSLTASGCRTRCCGRAPSGSEWPRSAIRASTSAPAPTCSNPLHHRRRPGPRDHRRGQEFADSTGDAAASPSVFFWNVIGQAWNNGSNATTSRSRARQVGQAQCSVGFGAGAACGDLTVTGNKVELSASNLHRAPR